MNPLTNVRNTQNLNKRELELGLVGTKSSWHDDFKDSAWIFVGGLPYEVSEGDIIAVFSQYGEIVNLNLVRDRQSGKSKGFGFICYEDQRSSILAVDNLNSTKLLNRTMRVNHVADYKIPKEHGDEDEATLKLREFGCAPKMPDSEEEEMGEEPEASSKKSKKEKKKKKKKEKKKKAKKRKEESNSDTSESSDQDHIPDRQGARTSPLSGHPKVKAERTDRGYLKYEGRSPNDKRSRRYSEESESDTARLKSKPKAKHHRGDSPEEWKFDRKGRDTKVKVEKDYTVRIERGRDPSENRTDDGNRQRATEFTKDYSVKRDRQRDDYREYQRSAHPENSSGQQYDDRTREKKRKDYEVGEYDRKDHEKPHRANSKRHRGSYEDDSDSEDRDRSKQHPARDDYYESRVSEKNRSSERNRDSTSRRDKSIDHTQKHKNRSRERRDTDSGESDPDDSKERRRGQDTYHRRSVELEIRAQKGRNRDIDDDRLRRKRSDSRDTDTDQDRERQRGRGRSRSVERDRDRDKGHSRDRNREKMKIVVEITK